MREYQFRAFHEVETVLVLRQYIPNVAPPILLHYAD